MTVEAKEATQEGHIDVGGHRLYYRAMGEGSPIVVLECGLGGTIEEFAIIQPEIAKFTRVIAYDRAGLGRSDNSAEPPEAQHIIKNLHILLEKTGSKPPYILAGHSLGGVIIRLYTHFYPEEVKGLVFIDSSHPDQNNRFAKVGGQAYVVLNIMQIVLLKLMPLLNKIGLNFLTKALTKGSKNFPVEAVEKMKEFYTSNKHLKAQAREFDHIDKLFAQGRVTGDLGSRPVIVLSAGALQTGMSPAIIKTFQQMHQEIAQLSTKGKRVVVDGATHISLLTNSDYAAKVTEAVREAWESAREAHS